jgi:predicted RND superfamily exporter protein
MIPGTPAELTSPRTLQAVATLSEQIKGEPNVKSVVSPLTLLSAGTLPEGVSLAQPGVATSIEDDAVVVLVAGLAVTPLSGRDPTRSQSAEHLP